MKLKLSKDDGKSLVYGDLSDFELVEEKLTGSSRWALHYEGVFKQKSTGKYYKTFWRVGATEHQDERPFDYEDCILVEVEPYEEILRVTRYRTKE